jgi:hypothetical protein
VARESPKNIGMTENLAVYIPQSYNYADNLMLVEYAFLCHLLYQNIDRLYVFIIAMLQFNIP